MARETYTEALKMEAQSAFTHIDTAYQEFPVHSGLTMDRENALNMEIAQDAYTQPEPGEGLFSRNHSPDADHTQPEPDLEPEM